MSKELSKHCINCDGSFTKKKCDSVRVFLEKRKYCSQKCCRTYLKKNPTDKMLKTFYRKEYLDNIKHRNDCKCVRCLPRTGKNNNKWKGGKTELVCKYCSKKFSVDPYLKNKAIYCSMLCSKKGRRGLRINNSGQFKREICLDKILERKYLLGHLRNLAELREWRWVVMNKFDYRCCLCGDSTNLHTDHIKPLVEFAVEYKWQCLQNVLDCKEFWKIENGRVLCEKCHRNTNTWGRKPENNN